MTDSDQARFQELLDRANSALEAKDYDRARLTHSSMDRFMDNTELTERQERMFDRVMRELRNNENFDD